MKNFHSKVNKHLTSKSPTGTSPRINNSLTCSVAAAVNVYKYKLKKNNEVDIHLSKQLRL